MALLSHGSKDRIMNKIIEHLQPLNESPETATKDGLHCHILCVAEGEFCPHQNPSGTKAAGESRSISEIEPGLTTLWLTPGQSGNAEEFSSRSPRYVYMDV